MISRNLLWYYAQFCSETLVHINTCILGNAEKSVLCISFLVWLDSLRECQLKTFPGSTRKVLAFKSICQARKLSTDQGGHSDGFCITLLGRHSNTLTLYSTNFKPNATQLQCPLLGLQNVMTASNPDTPKNLYTIGWLIA